METYLVELGRICLGALFVVAGVRHFFLQPPLTAIMAARGVPMPRLALLAGSTFEIVCGALVALDQLTTWAAVGLVLFTIVATLIFLPFWRLPPGPEREGAFNGCLANIGVVGGLLIVAGLGG